jgi:hypothetical protein
MMVDTVAALSEGGRQLRGRYCFQPMMQPGEMKRTFVEQGLDRSEKSCASRSYRGQLFGFSPNPAGQKQAGGLTGCLPPSY